jgi:hypothetical protein
LRRNIAKNEFLLKKNNNNSDNTFSDRYPTVIIFAYNLHLKSEEKKFWQKIF